MGKNNKCAKKLSDSKNDFQIPDKEENWRDLLNKLAISYLLGGWKTMMIMDFILAVLVYLAFLFAHLIFA